MKRVCDVIGVNICVKKILRRTNMSTIKIVSDVCHGQLLKWTNYVKGYRGRWFLLQNGFLSYYK